MNYRKYITILAFIVIICLIIYASAELQGRIISSVNYLGGYFREHIVLGGLIFFGISVVSVLVSPFSSVPLIPSAIMAWGSFLTFSLLFPAWIAGGILAYFVGSLTQEKILKHFISFEKVEYYKKRISPRSQFLLVFIFQAVTPSEISSYTLGIIRYDFKKYLAIIALTDLLYALSIVYATAALISGKILLFIVVAVIATIVFYVLYREFNKKLKEKS
jgi:uncharacterized membrane protein YdjX (TVP38/TMEM64 family)